MNVWIPLKLVTDLVSYLMSVFPGQKSQVLHIIIGKYVLQKIILKLEMIVCYDTFQFELLLCMCFHFSGTIFYNKIVHFSNA